MRTLCILLIGSAAAFAQQQPESSGRFYGPLISGDWTPKAPQPKGRLAAQPILLSQTCAVPLLEMQIPEDAHYTIRQATPNLEKMAPMPQAKLPAPPCPR